MKKKMYIACLITFAPDVININTNDESPYYYVIINHQRLMELVDN